MINFSPILDVRHDSCHFGCTRIGLFEVKMKICSKCKEHLDLSEFYKFKRSKDGLQAICKKCNQISHDDWVKNNRKKVNTISRRHQIKYREKHNARACVNRAISKGLLKKWPCIKCGEIKSEAHHESYEKEKWLEVVWLCSKHHADRHLEIKSEKCKINVR